MGLKKYYFTIKIVIKLNKHQKEKQGVEHEAA